MLSTYWVTNPGDGLVEGPGDQPGTLRQAVFDANNAPGFDTIEFTPSLDDDTILLDLDVGELHIRDDVTIDTSLFDAQGNFVRYLDVTVSGGHGTNGIPADGDGIRIFRIADSNDRTANVKIIGLTITGGDLSSNFQEFISHGGGIVNYGSLTLDRTTVTDNAVVHEKYTEFDVGEGKWINLEKGFDPKGGGIYSDGPLLKIENGSEIVNNQAKATFTGDFYDSIFGPIDISRDLGTAEGGGIYATRYDDNATVTVEILNSTVDNNSASIVSENVFRTTPSDDDELFLAQGGGVHFERLSPKIEGSTISSNRAWADLIFAHGDFPADQGEIFVRGGGLSFSGPSNWNLGFTLLSSTISGNAADLKLSGDAAPDVTDRVEAVGGAIYSNELDMDIRHSTIYANSATVAYGVTGGSPVPFFLAGGGIYAVSTEAVYRKFALSHVLAANNFVDLEPDPNELYPKDDDVYIVAEPDIDWSVVYSLIEKYYLRINGNLESLADNPDDVIGNITGNQNPLGVKSLRDNGGLTQTHALKLESPAVDAGDPDAEAGVDGVPEFDQRGEGYLRIFDIEGIDRTNDTPPRGPIDIGAFELRSCDLGADFDEDGDVNGDDFLIWQTGFGQFPSGDATHGDGDANCDGYVDGDDFLIWQAEFGSGAGAGTQFDENAAVQVAEVIISGSNSVHDPFSFSTVVGSGAQLQTVPVGGADTISIVFNEHANVTAGDLDIVGLYTANEPTLAEFSYDVDTMTATWQFDGWALGDQYAIVLSDGVFDAEGSALDGEWTNPAHITTVNVAVSEFPSGDGMAGGDFSFVMTLLPGDANLDNMVNGVDYMIWQANYGTGVGALFVGADFDGNGAVDANDFNLWQANNGSIFVAIWILSDLDGDGDVDNDDAVIMVSNWGMNNATWADGDLNGDGVIDVGDYWLWYGQNGLDLDVVS